MSSIKDSVGKMILSASGWRKVFAISGDEEDKTAEIGSTHEQIATIIGETFINYIENRFGKNAKIVIGMDARPTGDAICKAIICALMSHEVEIIFVGISAAPEIMAFSKNYTAFIYVSASHNPIGHNGIKFGLNDGGVLPASEATILIEDFLSRCNADQAENHANAILKNADAQKLQNIYNQTDSWKKKALVSYEDFTKEVVADTKNDSQQKDFFAQMTDGIKKNPLGIVCDMNGSARSISIDAAFFAKMGVDFFAINNTVGNIVHAIVPEQENLLFCADEMKKLQSQGKNHAILGYMPDCDGDRGNIVFWNQAKNQPEILMAQEVFALSVLAEISCLYYMGTPKNLAVAVNCPTSMRIEEIARAFNAKVFRAEVGEANVVNLARKLRSENYTVRILGEGSNGGNITHPAAVRDPLNTLFALIKLLVIRDSTTADGKTRKGLFHIWCELSNQKEKYRDNFTFVDILKSLPSYTTTSSFAEHAKANITQKDHAKLKANYQKVFLREWQSKKTELETDFGITGWQAISNNGSEETQNVSDFSISGKGGFKILFTDKNSQDLAFMWMRGSGTEPVFRIQCDVKGDNPAFEKKLLEWHTKMLLEADKM
ncbi:MAG: phosphoglucomutase [Treponemataceae bacterium]